MSNIKIMSESLANKIAAGEVVERIASVIKELVENSIDASSTSIKVELDNSGFKQIKVSDDGIGMSYDDASKAFLRHATSKLVKEDDLFFINTLGFRGEALPSIASVSIIEMETNNGTEGTYLKLVGGKLEQIINKEKNKGTCISVNDLFFNTPARLKYLKNEAYELSLCVSYIEKLAFSHPEIKFSLYNNGKCLVKTSGSNDLLKCIFEIYGLDVSKSMFEIKGSNDDYDVFGYICKPEKCMSSRNHMITIINDRVVKNNELNRVINDGYYTYKPDSRFPIVVLKIDTDPTLIDVNIHPTKQDIKFSKMDTLSDLVLDLIKNTLYENILIPNIKFDSMSDFKNNETSISEDVDTINDQVVFDFGSEDVKDKENIKDLKMYPVGLALGTYIIAQNDTGIFLIDQHAAQERINYEKYFNALKSSEVHVTGLLIPISIELSPSDYLIVKNDMHIFERIGIVLEEFGLNTFIVKSHPTWLKNGYEEEQIRKIIELVIINHDNFDEYKFNEHVSITLACKTSIKANYNITLSEQEDLLNQLVNTENPYNCPHGRPTIIKFSIYELEKLFKRAM